MADNRMWLVYRPRRLGIMLGKRLGLGWYAAPEKAELERFFEYLAQDPIQDDFILLLEEEPEDRSGPSWHYADEKVEGFRVFEFDET